ncbi:ABC transporter permease [Nesterenkonia ebinurensis]|uniref:ABC transporter permease n=1 Tax=Nesterenkonia ebinurensis TaxID=2608252 RepID=UPI00123DB821|nr:ABC transporter permease subunit [Nesterenkonia ebinurensis]
MNPILRAIGAPLVRLAASLAVIVTIWVGVLWFFDVSPIIGKGPLDVYAYLFTHQDAAEHRELVFGDFWITMLDTLIGFGVGMFVAAVTAMAFQISKGFEAAVMPLAMICRSVPLVAMAPIIVLIFGRDFASVAAMGTIVVIFPALVTIVEGLRSASPAMTEVVQVYGGGQATVLRRVGLPASLPSFFTAARVSIPGALTGAMLAEWLATGDGMGYGIIQAVTRTDYDRLWASVLIVTLASLVVYSLIGVVERLVARSTGIGLAA